MRTWKSLKLCTRNTTRIEIFPVCERIILKNNMEMDTPSTPTTMNFEPPLLEVDLVVNNKVVKITLIDIGYVPDDAWD
jgi:hypothetical protein